MRPNRAASQAEADARRALLGVLKNQGKYNPQTPKFIIGLAAILVEQGRYEDAEKLKRFRRWRFNARLVSATTRP